MENEKKLQAAIAGVMYYMMTEEEQQRRSTDNLPYITPNSWALNGRQTIMQWRTFVQRRVLKK